MVAGAFFVQGLTAGTLLSRLPALQERHALTTTAVTVLIAAVGGLHSAASAGLGWPLGPSLLAVAVVAAVLVALIAPFPLPAAPPSDPPSAARGRPVSVVLIGIAIVSFFVVDSATAD